MMIVRMHLLHVLEELEIVYYQPLFLFSLKVVVPFLSSFSSLSFIVLHTLYVSEEAKT